jgi:hypothetical protein
MTHEHLQLDSERKAVMDEVGVITREIANEYPKIAEGLATALGSTAGGAGSLAALYLLGTTGLSAVGITSGLATAGALVGGGMVAGIGVLAAPVALLGVAGFALANKRKKAKMTAALNTAIQKLYEIQTRLMDNAEYYRDEITTIKAAIQHFQKSKP